MANTLNISDIRTIFLFGRPHTVVGTTIAIIVLSVINHTQNLMFLLQREFVILLGIAIATNYFIVGLNQIVDYDIDRINKPELPIPAETLSRLRAWIIVIGSGLFSLVLSWNSSIYLGITISIALFIGSIYSLEPIRLKKYGWWGPLAIIFVRGFVMNIGISIHISWISRKALIIPVEVIYLVLLITLVSTVIASFKDIPDIVGDEKFGIQTPAIKYGWLTIYNLSITILLVTYTLSLGVAMIIWRWELVVVEHIILLILGYKTFSKGLDSLDLKIKYVYLRVWYFSYLIYFFVLVNYLSTEWV